MSDALPLGLVKIENGPEKMVVKEDSIFLLEGYGEQAVQIRNTSMALGDGNFFFEGVILGGDQNTLVVNRVEGYLSSEKTGNMNILAP